ncbi:MAG TPA: DUF6438 domain-containing protein [Candidatus Acidoferrum sp.]|nr:DUF6438 domain-containing protein [Candidatus Acidoferrum sp.]
MLIVISALAFAFLMFSLLHAATGPAIRKRFAFATGMIAIFAMPMMYVWLLKISWARGAAYAFWQDFRPAFLGAEIVVAVLLVGISRLRSLSLWTTAPLVMSHCIFWLYFSWPHLYALPQQELLSPRFFMLAFPLSGLIWLLYWQTAHTNQPQPGRDVGRVRLALGALAAIVFLLLAWWPSHAHPIGGNGQLDSLVIELDRSRCFGSCLPYDMTIRGDGDVRFTGWHRYRETEYTNHATLAPEQVSQIVQALNRSRFFALDDRAFDWCFDTPTVSISVTVNGKSKSVGSDSDCFGPKFGRQARFVQAAAEIDSIVGTSRWIQR